MLLKMKLPETTPMGDMTDYYCWRQSTSASRKIP